MNKSRTLFFAAWMAGIFPLVFSQQSWMTSTSGGGGGTPFTDDIVSGSSVAEFHIYAGNYVDAIQMLYILPDGRKTLGIRHGGPGGQQNIFRLESGEYIIGLSLKYGDYIDSLEIRTNKRTSSKYGSTGGKKSSRIDVPSGNQAVGLTGRAGKYLDSIGLVYIPVPITISGQTAIAGGKGGSAFSDRNIPEGAIISEVRVRAGNFIDSIQAIYTLKDGRTFEGPVHGGQGGKLSVFRLNPDEYITGLSGRFGEYIDSMTIQSNQRSSQAFGGSGGRRNYSISVPQGNMAVSLAGRSAEYLDSISLNFAPIDRSYSRRRNLKR
jgi:hypothetical protein